MSPQYYRDNITRLTREKASLEGDRANEHKRIVKLRQDIMMIQRTITKYTSPSMLQPKQSRISTLEKDIVRHQGRAADIEKKIARKMDNINQNTRSLERAEKEEQRRQDAIDKRRCEVEIDHVRRLAREPFADQRPAPPMPGFALPFNVGTVAGRPDEDDGKKPIRVFYAYSRDDKRLLKQLRNHLTTFRREGLIEDWHDREIVPGSDWESEISENLEIANIILLLVSSSFLASDYCYNKEMKRALEKHDAGEVTVVPIILRPVVWDETPFRGIQALPDSGKPVITWRVRDEAWADVAQGLRRTIRKI